MPPRLPPASSPSAHMQGPVWELFRESCTTDPKGCDGRLDRYGLCCVVQTKTAGTAFRSRDPDFQVSVGALSANVTGD